MQGRVNSKPIFVLFIIIILATEGALLTLAVSKYGFDALSKMRDGPEYMEFAHQLLSGHYPFDHLPLYPFFIRIASLFMSISTASVVVDVVAYAVTVVIFWKIAIQRIGRREVLITAMFASLFPHTLLWNSVTAGADLTALLFSALTYYFMLIRKEKSMLLCSALAVVSHSLALLILPGVIYYFISKNPKEVPKAIVTVLPFLLLSAYRYATVGDFFYYIHVHTTRSLWSEGPLSYPFATISYVVSNSYGPFTLLLLVVTYSTYIFALVVSARQKDTQSILFSLASVVFVILLVPGGFYFVPRFVIFAFPVLFNIQRQFPRSFPMSCLLAVLIVGSVAYAFYMVLFLL